MNRENLKIALMLVALFAAVAIPIVIAFYAIIYLPTSGVTTTLELELTDLAGNPQTILDWNTVGNGTHTQQSKIKNIGTAALSLSMSTDNAEPWMVQGWNCTGQVLQPNQQIIIEWTLTLTDAPQHYSFSYTTSITGTET